VSFKPNNAARSSRSVSWQPRKPGV